MIVVVPLLVLAVVAVVGVTVFDFLFRPTFRRLAFRNVSRRKSEAALVVLGSLLGTAIITSSFVVGDTLDASIRDLARTQYGPIDETVHTSGVDRLDEIEGLLRDDPIDGTDGVLRIVTAPATVATRAAASARRAEPDAMVHEVDFRAAERFGADPAITGFTGAPATPGPGEAVVGDDLAAELDVGEGDVVVAYLYGEELELQVVGTVPRLGVAGFYPLDGSRSPVLFVQPGAVAGLASVAAGAGAATATPPDGRIVVSNDGGVFDSVDGTARVVDELEARTAGVEGARVAPSKQDLLDDAKENGEQFGGLFSAIGSFSVLAGILLLVNIFVMLSEERKTELGMLRAVGFKRNHLVRAFALEGTLYSLAAAAAGALTGIGLGRVIVIVTAELFRQDGDDLQLRFGVVPSSVLIGFLVGLAIALLTVWATSLRIVRLNVIRAIRDLPEPSRTGARLRTIVAAAVSVVAFGAVGAAGIVGKTEIPALLGPAVAVLSTIPLLTRIVSRRWAITLPCLVSMAWGVTSFLLLTEVFEGSNIFTFVVQGVVLVVPAVAAVIVNDDQFARITDRLSGSRRGLATRLGLANPLAKRFRTGLLLAMFSIVLFILTFLATFSAIFDAQGPRMTREASSGYDVLVDSNPSNPLTERTLREQPEVGSVATLVRAYPKFDAPELADEPEFWALSGFDEGLLERRAPELSKRAPEYGSDEEVWRAVLASPDLAVIDSFFLQSGGGPPQGRLEVGESFEVIDPSSDERHRLTVAGVVDTDWMFNGVLVSADRLPELTSVSVPNRHYVGIRDGVDPEAAADALTGRLLAFGTDAQTFRSIVDDGLSQQQGFLRLMQGFLALGLLIGTAGLGVVMVRAVRERRRQIGMLRAIGFSSLVVRAAFLIEAAFIALQGIVIGVGLGLITSWTLLSSSDTFGDQSLPFRIPWLALVALPAAALAGSLIAVYAPAAQAARIKPAVALRIAD